MGESSLSVHEANAQLTASGMFEISSAVVHGVDIKVWKNAPSSLASVLDLSLNHAEHDFLVYEDQRYTFAEHYQWAATVAWKLQELGLRQGDRVAIAARNLPQWVMAFWGILAAGGIAVPINAWWTTDELLYGFNDSESTIVFIDEERLERIRPDFDQLTTAHTFIVLHDDISRPVRLGPAHERVRTIGFFDFVGEVAADVVRPVVEVAPDDDATMFYTSGTTGRPKGAVGSHRNAVTNMMNLFFNGARAGLRYGREPEQRRNASLLNVPLFHATGCLASMTVSTAAGNKLVMMHHFDAERALQLIEREEITMIGGVPTIAMQILDHPKFGDYNTSSIKSVAYGGAPSPPNLVQRILTHFPGSQPSNGYGMTETSAAVCQNAGPDYVERPESCGTIVPVCEAAIAPEGWEGAEPPVLEPNTLGELWIKGPNIVRGYWNKPEATASTFTNGWCHTGDIAKIDDEGYIYIVDRAKDMIIRGGENVYSVIVEAALHEHPDVADCAVIGIPHETLGEEVAAVVVVHAGKKLDAEALRRFCLEHLAKFEAPTTFFFRADPLPRNPQGKILKRELRTEVLEGR